MWSPLLVRLELATFLIQNESLMTVVHGKLIFGTDVTKLAWRSITLFLHNQTNSSIFLSRFDFEGKDFQAQCVLKIISMLLCQDVIS